MNSDEKDALIDRLLKSKTNDQDGMQDKDPEDVMNNLNPAQLEMLTKVFNKL